jgi:hypothetical protein
MDANFCTTVRGVDSAASAHPRLAIKEKQGGFLDARPANRSSIIART